MAELVEDRLYLAVREERPPLLVRLVEIAGDHRQVRPEGAVGARPARDEAVHPRAIALVVTRKPVDEERTDVPSLAPYLVEAHTRVPDRLRLPLLDLDAEELAGDLEEAALDPVQLEVRSQLLLPQPEPLLGDLLDR